MVEVSNDVDAAATQLVESLSDYEKRMILNVFNRNDVVTGREGERLR